MAAPRPRAGAVSLAPIGRLPARHCCASIAHAPPAPPPQSVTAMPRDSFIREKFTRERTAAKKLVAEYFQRFPKERYQTEVESWHQLQSQNIEFVMKRLREPIESDD